MTIQISLGTFNFEDNTYTSQATGGVYSFGVIPPVLYQVYTAGGYIYTALDVGLKVYDLLSSDEIAYLNYSSGFTSVGGDLLNIYLGTTTSGIKTLNKATVSGTPSSIQDLCVALTDYADVPNLTSSCVRYLHGHDDGIFAVTDSGVDYFRTTGNPQYRSYATISGGYKCFVAGRKGYYTTISGTTYSGTTSSGTTYSGSNISYQINRINSLLTDWAIPDYIYSSNYGLLEGCGTINDIFVTEGTATDGINNTLFCATGSGVYIIDESNNSCSVYYTTTVA